MPKKDRGLQSKFHKLVESQLLPNARKGKIAEAAIQFRLALYDMEVYKSVFDNSSVDLVVKVENSSSCRSDGPASLKLDCHLLV